MSLALDNKAMKPVLRLFPTYTDIGDTGARRSAMAPNDQLIEFISGALRE